MKRIMMLALATMAGCEETTYVNPALSTLQSACNGGNLDACESVLNAQANAPQFPQLRGSYLNPADFQLPTAPLGRPDYGARPIYCMNGQVVYYPMICPLR